VCGKGSSPLIKNCTITGNSAVSGGGVYSLNSFKEITNCIIWDNAGGSIFPDDDSSSMNVSYSCIEDGWEGEGNIDIDPLFVNGGDFDFDSWKIVTISSITK
jgi:hypothetical protein